jgi:hypothetical protein
MMLRFSQKSNSNSHGVYFLFSKSKINFFYNNSKSSAESDRSVKERSVAENSALDVEVILEVKVFHANKHPAMIRL